MCCLRKTESSLVLSTCSSINSCINWTINCVNQGSEIKEFLMRNYENMHEILSSKLVLNSDLDFCNFHELFISSGATEQSKTTTRLTFA